MKAQKLTGKEIYKKSEPQEGGRGSGETLQGGGVVEGTVTGAKAAQREKKGK